MRSQVWSILFCNPQTQTNFNWKRGLARSTALTDCIEPELQKPTLRTMRILSSAARRLMSSSTKTEPSLFFNTSLLPATILRCNVAGSTATRSPIMTPMTASLLVRSMGTKPPGYNPLDLIRKESLARNLCDEHGYRRPGVHWVFTIAITPDDITQVHSIFFRICVCLYRMVQWSHYFPDHCAHLSCLFRPLFFVL